MLMDNSKKDLQSRLEIAFGFNPKELGSNRQGLLSQRQSNKLQLSKKGRAKGMFIARLAFGFIVLMVAGISAFMVLSGSVNSSDERYILFGFSGFVILILISSLLFEFIVSRPLMNDSIKSIDGVIEKVWTKEIGKHELSLGNAYYFKIKGKKMQLETQEQMEALMLIKQKKYCIFYIPNGGVPIILSVGEPF